MVHLQLLLRKHLLPRTGGADLLNQGRPLLLRFKDAVDTIEALYFECNWLEICLKCFASEMLRDQVCSGYAPGSVI